MNEIVEERRLVLIESMADILLELLSRRDIDTDTLTNYWGGETPIEFILEREEDEEVWN